MHSRPRWPCQIARRIDSDQAHMEGHQDGPGKVMISRGQSDSTTQNIRPMCEHSEHHSQASFSTTMFALLHRIRERPSFVQISGRTIDNVSSTHHTSLRFLLGHLKAHRKNIRHVRITRSPCLDGSFLSSGKTWPQGGDRQHHPPYAC